MKVDGDTEARVITAEYRTHAVLWPARYRTGQNGARPLRRHGFRPCLALHRRMAVREAEFAEARDWVIGTSPPGRTSRCSSRSTDASDVTRRPTDRPPRSSRQHFAPPRCGGAKWSGPGRPSVSPGRGAGG